MLKSQKEASKKWISDNRDRYRYLQDRSKAFSFVNPTTKTKKERLNSQNDYIGDLKELKKAIEEKLK